MLAVAFSPEALVPDHGVAADTPPLAIPELVRPPASTLRALRELEQLGVSLHLVGDLPRGQLLKIAEALWFRGEVGSGDDPVEVLANATGLPAECTWFATGLPILAARAAKRGMNVILTGSPQTSLADTGSGAYHTARDAEDILEFLRVPYTRAALALRFLMDAAVHAGGTPH